MEAFRQSLIWGWTVWFSIFHLVATNFEASEKVIVNTVQNNDSYFAGGEIHIEAPVKGDLLMAGGEIVSLDSIYNDLIAAGGKLEIEGIILDDLRVFGGEIVLSGIVNGDAIMAGGKIIIEPNAVIRGNVIIAGGEIEMLGTIEGYLNVKGGDIEIAGTVDGGSSLYARNTLDIMGTLNGIHTWVAGKIHLNQASNLRGNISYWHEGGEIDFGTLLKNGVAEFDADLKEHYQELDWEVLGKYWGTFWLLRILGAFLLIMLLKWVFPWVFREAGVILNQEYLQSTGKGLLFIIAIPLLIAILFMIVIGIPVGVFGLFLYTSILFFSHILASVVLAESINNRRVKSLNNHRLVILALGIYLGIKVINWIPFLGWYVSLFLTIAAIGALISSINIRRKRFHILLQN